MKYRSLFLIALIIIVPLGALTWAVLRIAESDQVVVQQQFRGLLMDRLQDVNGNISTFFEDLEADVLRITAVDSYDIDGLRQINRSEPQLQQLFVLTPDGLLRFPDPTETTSPLSFSEQSFLVDAAKMFIDRDLRDEVLRAEQGDNGGNLTNFNGISPRSRRNTSGPKQQVSPPSQPSQTVLPESAVPNLPTLDAALQDPRGQIPDAQVESPRQLPRQLPQQLPQQSRVPFAGPPLANTRLQDNDASNNGPPLNNVPLANGQPVTAPQQTAWQNDVQQAYQQNSATAWIDFDGSSGWFNWYWDRGVNLIYWQRRPSGEIVGAALERARWISDLIGQLPDTVNGPSNRNLETRVRLVNASGNSVYQWGGFEPDEQALPFCEVPVAFPLESWRLQCFVSTAQLATGTSSSVWLSLVTLLTAVATVLVVCGFLFVRQYALDMREATQQVSFVNQVSHELKTPLTNIRMYAELLEGDLGQLDAELTDKPQQRLNIILSEGQRLSRLIGNVLTFARQKRRTLQLQPREERPCHLITQIVDRFRPALQDQHIEIRTHCDDNKRLSIDPDFVEQILGNLISNVEKYAASGGLLDVSAEIDGDLLIIDVRDNGPGIERSKREEVFQPFARVSNNVSYAAGTGIGLPIARELARLHGGDLILRDSPSGCWFQATVLNQAEIS